MSEEIIRARKIFKEHLEGDKDFRYGYQSVIAMLLYDKYGITSYKERNQAALDIMAVVFDAKNFKKKLYNPEDMITSRWEILDFDD